MKSISVNKGDITMRILWLVNVPLPEASQLMNETPTPFGGWLLYASAQLSKVDGVQLFIAFPKIGLSDVLMLRGEKITYYGFPPIKKKKQCINGKGLYFHRILDQSKPDIVHIFGTEYPHTLAMVNACLERKIKVVISIQGLVSIYAKHYMACLPVDTINTITFRDFIKRDNLKLQQNKFIERGRLEIEALQGVKHIVGRTTWDKACTSQINSDATYYFCNEILREVFYEHTWDINKCKRYSIFVSQGSYPIKGLHFMLEAMPIVLRRFPDARLYVSGNNLTKSDTLMDRLKRTSYGKYLNKLVQRLCLEDKVIFTGVLDERQMCERFLYSHVFVCPSSIENSPNALGEAMLLGVPCVASDVGGVADMLKHKEEGFVYQHDAPYMLAHYVNEIFANDELSVQFSVKAREHAMQRHDCEKNNEALISIYKDILS